MKHIWKNIVKSRPKWLLFLALLTISLLAAGTTAGSNHAAALPAVAGGNETLRADFTEPYGGYSANDGTVNWSDSWTEAGDDNLPNSGKIFRLAPGCAFRRTPATLSVFRAVPT